MKHDLTSRNGFLSRKIKAFTLALGGLLCASFLAPSTVFADIKPDLTITPERLHSRPQNEVVILDTRSRWKFLLGHIRGAQHAGDWQDYAQKQNRIPGMLNHNKTFLAGKLNAMGIDKDKTIILYGDPSDKWRTDGRFFWMLEYLGFSKVAILEGGLESWSHNNFEVERGLATTPHSSKLKATDIQFTQQVYADHNWIQKHLNNPKVALIDNREQDEYRGATPYGSPRGGHIPGAVHIDWRDFFTEKGRLKDQHQLEALLKKNRIQPDQQIVVYCTGGVRSGMAYFVFRLLGYDVRNYDGSWWDWSHHSELPVES